jgi:hypothetical protein
MFFELLVAVNHEAADLSSPRGTELVEADGRVGFFALACGIQHGPATQICLGQPAKEMSKDTNP